MRNTGLQPQIGLKGKEKEGHSSLLPASFGEWNSLQMAAHSKDAVSKKHFALCQFICNWTEKVVHS